MQINNTLLGVLDFRVTYLQIKIICFDIVAVVNVNAIIKIISGKYSLN